MRAWTHIRKAVPLAHEALPLSVVQDHLPEANSPSPPTILLPLSPVVGNSALITQPCGLGWDGGGALRKEVKKVKKVREGGKERLGTVFIQSLAGSHHPCWIQAVYPSPVRLTIILHPLLCEPSELTSFLSELW